MTPYEHPTLYLVASLEAYPIEIGSVKEIRLSVLDADADNKLYDQRLQLPVAALPQAVAGHPVAYQMVVQMTGLVFKQFGDYQVNISISGEPKKTITLLVREPPQQAQA